MTQDELLHIGRKAVLSAEQNADDYERLAEAVHDLYSSGDPHFREHIKNRSKRVVAATGVGFDADNFDIEMARAFVADELGFESWDALIGAVGDSDRPKPILFQYAKAAMWRGDFTSFEEMLGTEAFKDTIVAWHERGYFDGEAETLNEILSASCMLGQAETAEYLLDKGIEPYAGMRTWLAGPHWAASSGRLDVIKMLLAKNVPLEVENKYGGTVLGQALWSAINEHTDDHAEIIERLIDAGAHVWPYTLDWWEKQEMPVAKTKERVAEALRKREQK